jgi:hypothetical protein
MLTSRVVRKVFVNVPSVITGPKRVKVGFPAGEADADNIQKAIWNEFGTRGGASGGGWGGPVPERPFMRNAMRATYINIGGRNFVVEGSTLTPNVFLDEIHATDWIIARTEEETLGILLNNSRIKFDDSGMQQIASTH